MHSGMDACQATPRRSEITKETPGISFDAVGKQVGEEWRALSAADKKKYQDTANEATAKWRKAKAEHGNRRPQPSTSLLLVPFVAGSRRRMPSTLRSRHN